MKKYLIAILFLLPLLAKSQAADPFEEDQERSNPSTLSSVAIQSAGMIMDASFEAQLENFRKLAPESAILKRDLSGFSKDPQIYDQQSGAFSIYVDFPFESDAFGSLHPKIRIGVQFMLYGALNYKMTKTDYFRIDTLSGSGTGDVYVDSTSTEHIEMEYRQNQVLVDAGFLLSTNEKARWAVMGGISIAMGFSSSAGTRITYDLDQEYIVQLPGASSSISSYSEEETFTNEASFVGVASIPLILDFRIARKGNFFARSHLYTEVRPFLYYTSIPEIANQPQTGFSLGFGFRYEI